MKNLILIASLMISSLASAETMSCLVSLSRAEDMTSTALGLDIKTSTVVKVLLKNGDGETELKINGEDILVTLGKRPFADVYDLSVVLFSPVADRPNGAGFVAALSEFLINEGPSDHEGGFSPDVGPESVVFAHMMRPNGTLVMTPKLVNAAKKQGLWGKRPFTSSVMYVQNSHELVDSVNELVKSGALAATDVVALMTVFNCSLNK